jgi:hypothetical protein
VAEELREARAVIYEISVRALQGGTAAEACYEIANRFLRSERGKGADHAQ